MAVDLFELVDPLKRSVNAPGGDAFPTATDNEFVGYLSDSFWELRMLNMLTEYTESDGLIAPINGTTDIPREMQSLIILFAAITIVTNEMKALDTLFRAKGGPAEFEVQKSASLLKDVLAELQRRRLVVEQQLFAMGEVTDTYIDSVIARDASMGYGGMWWVN